MGVISEGEEEVEDMLIKICSTQVWREHNYTRGQDYMRLFHHLKTCFEIQHGQKYSYYRHTRGTNCTKRGWGKLFRLLSNSSSEEDLGCSRL